MSRVMATAHAACWLGALALALPMLASAHTAPPAPVAQAGAGMDRAALETFVVDLLNRRPELVRDALQALETREQIAKAQRVQQALVTEAPRLFRDPDSPSIGPADADVTVVEFIDYRCPHCRRMSSTVADLLAADPRVRVVFKEFPILGADSLLAARAALAAHRQGKYAEFHKALIATESINEITVLLLAESLGLNLERFQQDRSSPEVGAAIDANYALASALDIGGTPAFVVGRQLIPGAPSLVSLTEAVRAARATAQQARN